MIKKTNDYKILSGCIITNDDGETPLLETTVSVMESLVEKGIIIVPRENRNGCSSSITLNSSIEIEEFNTGNGFRKLIVSTYPSDGIRYVLKNSLKGKDIKLVLSGINYGYNIGYSCVNSGTVGAAQEGIRFGLSGIALSAAYGTTKVSTKWLNNVRTILKNIISVKEIYEFGPVIININIPKQFKNNKVEYLLLPVSKVIYNEWYEYRQQGNKKIVILRGDNMIDDPNVPDLKALQDGKVVLNVINTSWTKNYSKVKKALQKCTND